MIYPEKRTDILFDFIVVVEDQIKLPVHSIYDVFSKEYALMDVLDYFLNNTSSESKLSCVMWGCFQENVQTIFPPCCKGHVVTFVVYC